MANEIVEQVDLDLDGIDADIENILNNSAFDNLLLTISVQAKTREPFGYERVSRAFAKVRGKLTPAAYALLLAEAQIAGREEEVIREFPDIEKKTRFIILYFQEKHPQLVERIKQIVESSFPTSSASSSDSQGESNLPTSNLLPQGDK